MISFGIAASSYSGLIPLKTAYKKRGELLWAIGSKNNFINLHSAAFDTENHPKYPIIASKSVRMKGAQKRKRTASVALPIATISHELN